MFSQQSEQLWTALVSIVQVYRISQGLRTVLQDLIAEVIQSQKCFIGLHISPDESPNRSMFSCTHQYLLAKGSERKPPRWISSATKWDEGRSDMIERSAHISTLCISARLNISHARNVPVLGLHPAEEGSRLEFFHQINATPPPDDSFCLQTRPILPAMESTMPKNPTYGIMIIHTIKCNNKTSP